METAHGGGAINIITKSSKQSNASLALKGNTYGGGALGGDILADISHQFNDIFSLSLNFDGFNRDGYRDEDNQKGFYGASKFRFDLNDDSDLTFGFNYFQSLNYTTGYLTRQQFRDNPRQKGSDIAKTKITRPEVSLAYNKNFNDSFEFATEVYYQKQKIEYIKNILATAGTTNGTDQTGSGFEDSLTGFKLKGKYNYMDDSYLVLGYDFGYHEAKRNSKVSYSVPRVIPYHRMTTNMDMKKQSHSVYALDSQKINDVFYISAGGRYEYANYKTDRTYRNEMAMAFPRPGYPKDELFPFNTGSKNTSNFALELTPTARYSDTGTVYIKYERGFISPTPAQFVNRGNTGANAQNYQKICNGDPYCVADLDSEIYDTYEAGMSDYLFGFYGIDLAVFYTQTKDEIAYLGDPHSDSGAWWKYYNIDKTRRVGVDLSLRQDILDDLSFYQNFNFVDAKITGGVNDGKILPLVSKFKFVAGVNYEVFEGFNTFADFTYFSRSKDQGEPVNQNATGKFVNSTWIKEYYLTDLGINYTYKDLKIIGGIKNLFDKKYYTYRDKSANSGLGAYTPGDGRNYYVEFKYKF